MRRLRLHFIILTFAMALAAAFGAIAQPAAASPSIQTPCGGCHSMTPMGTVTATPSTTTPAPGASYTVDIAINLTAAGTTGYWITDELNTKTGIYGGPDAQTTWTPTMTAPMAPGTYTYDVWGVKSTGMGGMAQSVDYTITVAAATGASITSIVPAHATAGTSVTITGTGFGTATGTVAFGTTPATVTAWSDTEIVVTVPTMAAGATMVAVTPQGGTASAGFSFTIDAAGTDTSAPVTTVTGAINNKWYNHSLTIAFSASDVDGVSDVVSISYQVDDELPVVTTGATAELLFDVDKATHVDDGVHVITFFAVDVAGNIEPSQTLTVKIDTRKPGTRALAAARTHRYRYVRLRYEIRDVQPCSGKAKVTIKIKRNGTVVKTLRVGVKPVNRALSVRMHATLRAGTYRYYVYAKDTAGNSQANVASRRLVIRGGS